MALPVLSTDTDIQAAVQAELGRLRRDLLSACEGASSIPDLQAAFLNVLQNEVALRITAEQSANSDALTGLLNRRGFMAAFERELAYEMRRGDAALGVVVVAMDLNRFKPINDKYGHQAGDEALKVFAGALRMQFRAVDVPGRLGGDEFAVVMPHTNMEQAGERLGIIKERLVNLSFDYKGTQIEFGSALIGHPCNLRLSAETNLHNADMVLTDVKEAGRRAAREAGLDARAA